jgi:hypothetical protein
MIPHNLEREFSILFEDISKVPSLCLTFSLISKFVLSVKAARLPLFLRCVLDELLQLLLGTDRNH